MWIFNSPICYTLHSFNGNTVRVMAKSITEVKKSCIDILILSFRKQRFKAQPPFQATVNTWATEHHSRSPSKFSFSLRAIYWRCPLAMSFMPGLCSGRGLIETVHKSLSLMYSRALLCCQHLHCASQVPASAICDVVSLFVFAAQEADMAKAGWIQKSNWRPRDKLLYYLHLCVCSRALRLNSAPTSNLSLTEGSQVSRQEQWHLLCFKIYKAADSSLILLPTSWNVHPVSRLPTPRVTNCFFNLSSFWVMKNILICSLPLHIIPGDALLMAQEVPAGDHCPGSYPWKQGWQL